MGPKCQSAQGSPSVHVLSNQYKSKVSKYLRARPLKQAVPAVHPKESLFQVGGIYKVQS